jgi:hypothetical protein
MKYGRSVVVLHVVEEVNIEIGLVLILHLSLEELIVQEMKPVRLPAIQCHALAMNHFMKFDEVWTKYFKINCKNLNTFVENSTY